MWGVGAGICRQDVLRLQLGAVFCVGQSQYDRGERGYCLLGFTFTFTFTFSSCLGVGQGEGTSSQSIILHLLYL